MSYLATAHRNIGNRSRLLNGAEVGGGRERTCGTQHVSTIISTGQKTLEKNPVLRIRVVIPNPGSDLFHPGSELFPSRILIKDFKYLNPKKWFLSSRKYDPGCSSRIPDPDSDFLPIADTGSRGQKGTGSRIRIRNTEKISVVDP
jgi:hypothetical protein